MIVLSLVPAACSYTSAQDEGAPVDQAKPDFSGEWALDREASSLSPGADAVQSGFVTIEHDDPDFRYRASFVSEDGPLQYEYQLQSDGREIVDAQPGATTVSSLRWEGDVLIATFTTQRSDDRLDISFRHELLDGGQRLRAVEQLRGSNRSQDNVWVFNRR